MARSPQGGEVSPKEAKFREEGRKKEEGRRKKEEERKLRRKGKENAGKERRADHGGGWERSAGPTMVGPAERSVWPVPHPLG